MVAAAASTTTKNGTILIRDTFLTDPGRFRDSYVFRAFLKLSNLWTLGQLENTQGHYGYIESPKLLAFEMSKCCWQNKFPLMIWMTCFDTIFSANISASYCRTFEFCCQKYNVTSQLLLGKLMDGKKFPIWSWRPFYRLKKFNWSNGKNMKKWSRGKMRKPENRTASPFFLKLKSAITTV